MGIETNSQPAKLQGSDVKDFSVLNLIKFSKEVTEECILTLKSPDKSVFQKTWAVFKLMNNFMNREVFFFSDLIIVLAFSFYNFFTVHLMKGLTFYIVGNLILNCALFWFFCYCRSFNGKDVVTLRRSVQLLSHLFQFSTIGLLVLCKDDHNTIVDDEINGNNVKHRHEFVCTSMFLTINSAKIIWHTVVLFKTGFDEVASGFLISRGVGVDFITIVVTPIMMTVSMLSYFSATDLRNCLVKQFNINYEVNDITSTTPFYSGLADSDHDKKLEPAVLFLMYLSVESLGNVYQVFLDSWCGSNVMTTAMNILVFGVVLISVSFSLMSEHFLCGKVKFCSLGFFVLFNFCYRVVVLQFTQKILNGCQSITYYSYPIPCSPDNDNYDCYCNSNNPNNCLTLTNGEYSDDAFKYEFAGQNFFYRECAGVALSGLIMVAFLFQNRRNLRWKLINFLWEYVSFLLYALVLCPMRPIFEFVIGHQIKWNDRDKNVKDSGEATHGAVEIEISQLHENQSR